MSKESFLKRLLVGLLAATLLVCLGAVALADGEGVEVRGEIGFEPYVVAGNDLCAILPEVTGEATYEISFRDTDNNWVSVKSFTGPCDNRDLRLSTQGISQGLWGVRTVIKDANGKMVYRRTSVLNVTAAELSGQDIWFVVSGESALINETAKAWVYAPGALGVSIELGELGSWDSQGEWFGLAYIFDSVESFDFTATAYYADGTRKTAGPTHFESNTFMDEHMAFDPSVSEITNAGLDINFQKVVLADHSQNVYYDVQIFGLGNDYERVESWKNAAEPGDEEEENLHILGNDEVAMLHIDASDFEPNGVYNVIVSATAKGVTRVYKQYYRVYRADGVNEDVTLTINGSAEAQQERGTHEACFVRVEFPVGATSVRFYDGNGFRYINWEGNGPEYLDKGYWPMCFDNGFAGHYVMYAQAYMGEIAEDEDLEALDWGAPGNVIDLEIKDYGEKADGATLTLDHTVIHQGEPLTFQISDYGENVSLLWCYIERAGWGGTSDGVTIFKPNASGVLPTANLEPGLYALRTNCVASESHCIERELYTYFIITEPEWGDEFFFEVNPSEGVLAHQSFTVSAHKSGAKAIRIINEDGDPIEVARWDGDSIDAIMELNQGRYTLLAEAYMGDGDPDEDYENWISSDPFELNVGRKEKDWEVSIGAPDTLEAGNDLNFEVTNLDKADNWWWDIRVHKMSFDGVWTEVWRMTSDDMKAADGENRFCVPADQLEPGMGYSINVWADAYEYGGQGVDKNLFVIGETDDNLQLTATYNDQTHNDFVEVLWGDELHLSATAPGATALRVYEGTHWELVDDLEDGRADFDWRIEDGNTLFFVSALYDEVDWEQMQAEGRDWHELEGWSGISNVISVSPVCNEGELDEPVVTVEAEGDTFSRGDTITLTIEAPFEGANCGKRFHAYLVDEVGGDYDVGDWFDDDVSLPVTFDLSTTPLPEGEYTLVVDRCDVGYRWTGTDVATIHVVDELEAGQILFTLYGIAAAEEPGADFQVYRDEEYRFSAYAPGADRINVNWHYTDDDENDVDIWDYQECDSMADNRRDGREGVVEIWAEAFDDQGNPIATSERHAIRVLSRGQMEEPVVTCDPVAQAGESVDFTVDGLWQEGSDWWHITVSDKNAFDEEGEVSVYEETRDTAPAGTDAFTIPAEALTAGHAYRIHVWVDGSGYDGNDTDAYFFVEGAETGDVVLTLNGGTGPIDAQVREEVSFEANAPGAVALLRYNGRDWDCPWGYDPGSEGRWTWTEEMDVENRCYVVKVAYADDFDWASMDGDFNWDEFRWERDVNWRTPSNAVMVNITWQGFADQAEVSGVPDTVTRGDVLHLRLESAGDATSPSRATHFHAYFRDDDGRNYNWSDWSASNFDDLPVDFNISTAELPEGNYKLVMDSGALGYRWSNVEYPFTVRESDAGIVFNLCDDGPFYMNEDIRFGAYAPGASRIEVIVYDLNNHDKDYERDDCWNYGGDTACGRFRKHESAFDIVAVAYDENDQEIARETRSFEVLSRGQLEEPWIECDPALKAGEANTILVHNMSQEGLCWWDFMVWDDDQWTEENGSLEVYRINMNAHDAPEPVDGTLAITIPANTFAAGHKLHLHMWVDSDGYYGNNGDKYIVTYANTSQNVTLKVNGSSKSATGYAHVNAENEGAIDVAISAPGATAVRLWNGNNWDYHNDIAENGAVDMFGYWMDEGTFTMFVQASYQDPDTIDWNNFRWEDLIWEADISNQVTVTVRTRGDAFQAELDAGSYTVTRGDLLHFQLTGAGDPDDDRRATNFHAYIVDEDWNWDGNNDVDVYVGDADEFPRDLYLCTGYLDPNREYRLVVDACAQYYNWTTIEVPLAVLEPSGEEPIVFSVEEPIFRNEDFRISAYAPGASWMTVNVRWLDGEDNDTWGDWPGDYINGWGCRLNNEGGYELTAVAHYTDDEGNEIGARESEPIEVVVLTRGALSPATIEAEPLARADEDYTFRVFDKPWGDGSWYDIRIHDNNANDYVNDENDDHMAWRATKDSHGDGTDTFTVPAGTLIEGHSYSIDVWVDLNGYRGADSQAWLYVSSSEADDNVQISINGGDYAQVLTAQDVTIRIEAQGATMIRFWNGDHWECRGDFDPETGVAEFDYSWDYESRRKLFASATYTPFDRDSFDWNWESLDGWGGMSNVVSVDVYSLGDSTGTLTVTPLNLEGGVVVGDTARVLINCDGNVDPETVGNRVDVSIRNANNDMYSFHRYHDVTFPFEVGIPTAFVEPGRYHVVVSVCGVGYEWVESWTDQNPDEELPDLWFDLIQTEANSIRFGVARTNVLVGEDVEFSISAPGAEEVSIAVCRIDDEHEDPVTENYYGGDTVYASFCNWESGEMKVFANARYPGSENWVRSDPENDVIVTFNSKGTLERVWQEWPLVVWQGDSIRFRFTPVDNAEWYHLGVWDPEHGMLEQCSMDWSADDVPDGWVTLPNGNTLDAGKTYILGVDAFARGYEIGGSWCSQAGNPYDSPRLSVVSDDRVLYLPGALTDIEEEAFAGVNAEMIVVPSGVTSIGRRAFADCPNLAVVVNESQAEIPGDAFEGCRNAVMVADDTPAGE